MSEKLRAADPRQLNWPETPYKGFSYYGPDDVLLFAGRDKQIIDFAQLVGSRSTRLVLLHGATGCGKSSFLRAGLIPYLEGRLRGFEFRKSGRDEKALFIRSTDAPLQKLAEEVFKLASEGYTFTSPVGKEHVDLGQAILGAGNADDFVRLMIDEPTQLVRTLGIISEALPTTLVLIIDQGEEALSLSGGREIDDAQSRYFQFLAHFGESQFPLKLIVALRTDYFGIFLDAINERSPRRVQPLFYRLKNLDKHDLVVAIKRPTQVANYGPPPYGFTFEDQLPEQIVKDLVKTANEGGLVGGELPVLQVICETLYRNTKDRGKPWVIDFFDYIHLGEIETQLNDYVDRVLISFCKLKGMQASEHGLEISRWKDALTPLAKIQANNSVTTDIKTLDDLTAGAKTLNYFTELLDYLSTDEVGVLRQEKIRRLGSREAIVTVSLRHDAVGLVLVRWNAARQASRGIQQSWTAFVSMTAWSYFLIGLAVFSWASFQILASRFEFKYGVAALLGVGIGVAGFWTRRVLRMTDFMAHRVQLLPAMAMFIRAKPLDAEGLKELEQNPVFRLDLHTSPSLEIVLERARRRLLGQEGTEGGIVALYMRSLQHISDPNIRKLTLGALVLRRVTPELIKEVLADTCDVLVPDAATAQHLFEGLLRERSLFVLIDASLRGRSDMRRTLLSITPYPHGLHDRAIAFYAQRDGLIARAEELYHRLSLDQDPSVVDSRWQDGVELYLQSAVDEIPFRAGHYLRTKLGLRETGNLPSSKASAAAPPLA